MNRKYGITPEDRAGLLEAQEHRCAICGTREPGAHGFVIDHCHTSHRIRGMLCGRCNAGLGMFKDDQVVLEAAARYLERSELQTGRLPDMAA